MKATVHLICPACLRSFEPSDDVPIGSPPLCPLCRCVLDPERFPEEPEPDSVGSLDLTPEDLNASGRFGDEPAIPEVVGRFQLREYLGGGGYGLVYRAYDPRLDRDVALKVLKEPSPSARKLERFFREARAAAQLDHPNIVGLLDAGRDGPRCWIAYGYVAGRTLAAAIREAPLPPRRAARICRSLADALEHAHQRGVFHRDMKPANVLLDGRGEPRLTDFGLARRATVDPTMTQDGFIIGTPAYMSPEQAAGQGHLIDARSDVYSLGVVLFEMLCGSRPADLPSGAPRWRVEPTRRPFSPRSVAGGTPRALDRICRRALSTDPADRYHTARAMADDLDRWLTQSRRVGRGRLAVALGLGAVAVLIPVRLGRMAGARTDDAGTGHPAADARLLVVPGESGKARSVGHVVLSGGRVEHVPGCRALAGAKPGSWFPVERLSADERKMLRPCLLCIDADAPGSR